MKLKKRIGKYIWMTCVCISLAVWMRATDDKELSAIWVLCSQLFVVAGYHRMDVVEDSEDEEPPKGETR